MVCSLALAHTMCIAGLEVIRIGFGLDNRVRPTRSEIRKQKQVEPCLLRTLSLGQVPSLCRTKLPKLPKLQRTLARERSRPSHYSKISPPPNGSLYIVRIDKIPASHPHAPLLTRSNGEHGDHDRHEQTRHLYPFDVANPFWQYEKSMSTSTVFSLT